MAKIFYVVDRQEDDARISLFKTEKEALAYGTSKSSEFEMSGDAIEDEENGGFYTGSELSFRKGFLFSLYDGDWSVEDMDEKSAKEKCEDEFGEDGAGIFFDGFKKGAYGYLGNGADGKDYKWSWDGSEFTDARGNIEVKEETWVVYTLDKNGVKMHQGSYGSKEMAEKAIEISVKGGSYGGKSYSTAREKLGMMLFDEFKEATKKGEATWTYTAESVTKKFKHIQLFEQFVNEKKSDGTISDDEDAREEDLMANVEVAIDDLIAMIKKEANDIGGSFRSPGIESRVGKLLKEKLAKAKLIR